MLAISISFFVTVFLGVILWLAGRIVTKLVTDELFYQINKRHVFQKICHTLVCIAALSYLEKDRSLFIESALPDIDECLSNNRSLAAIGKSVTIIVSTRYALYGLWLMEIALSIATVTLMAWAAIIRDLPLWLTIYLCLAFSLILLNTIWHFYALILSKYSAAFGSVMLDYRAWLFCVTVGVFAVLVLCLSTYWPKVLPLFFLTLGFGLNYTVLSFSTIVYKRVTNHTDEEIYATAVQWMQEWHGNFRGWLLGYPALIRKLRESYRE